ncbi:hypothetical protein [Nitratidesulfovibrio liaohensis]|uniref:hypothetical protein n=1 Tax=Nitratidesulfovibrio liaohensis TaxID=2604158 RepID=UPI001FB9401C|nr:hypothetical protein [Nitratidesulfovibrio liaohensis]
MTLSTRSLAPGTHAPAVTAASRCLPLLFLLLLSMLSACAKVGPDFSTPDAAMPASWQDGAVLGAASGREVSEEWWRSFSDTTLDKLVAEARGENLALHVAALRVLEARARLGVAVGNLYPQRQQATGGLTWTHPSDRAPTAPQPDTGAGATPTTCRPAWGWTRRGNWTSGASTGAALKRPTPTCAPPPPITRPPWWP